MSNDILKKLKYYYDKVNSFIQNLEKKSDSGIFNTEAESSIINAFIHFKNQTDSMKEISLEARQCNVREFAIILADLNKDILHKKQKIELNLIICQDKHYFPLIIWKTIKKTNIFAFENNIDSNVQNQLSEYCQQFSSIKLYFLIADIQRDVVSCFFFALSQLRVVSSVSDETLKSFFTSAEQKEGLTVFTSLKQLPNIIKNTQYVKNLITIKNDHILDRLKLYVKELVNNKNQIKSQNCAIHYIKRKYCNKTIAIFTDKIVQEINNIIENTLLTYNNAAKFIKTRKKNFIDYIKKDQKYFFKGDNILQNKMQQSNITRRNFVQYAMDLTIIFLQDYFDHLSSQNKSSQIMSEIGEFTKNI